MKNFLAIIPARGGSKGIRRKNLRILKYKPLIWYVIDTAKNSKHVTDIVVTTDDKDIADYVEKLGVKVRKRPKHLAADDVPLDPVIYDAYKWYSEKFGEVDYVVTLQPTSPLLSPKTLDAAFKYMTENGLDTVLSVVDDTHLMWKEENGKIVPAYEKRLNRQWLTKVYKEAGAFLITKSSFVTETSRFGKKISVYEVPFKEAVDVDTPVDWLMAEIFLSTVKILIVTSGNTLVGLGHIYRTVTLADNFLGNEITFFLVDSNERAKEIIRQYGFKMRCGELKDVFEYSEAVDIVINDILDTEEWYINKLKKQGKFVVNFEDLGVGAQKAHIVFNALYERLEAPKNHRYGYKYVVLNEKFLIELPNEFSDEVKNVLVTFGGVDQNNLTLKTIRALEYVCTRNKIRLKVILGPAYAYTEKLEEYLKAKGSKIEVLKSVKNMASEMRAMDLAITSNGRTVYELAAMRVPMVSIAQNDRETLHTFARYNEGVEYLGIACNVTEDMIKDTVEKVIEDKEKRCRMHKALPYEELRRGAWRVKKEILEYYRRWREGEDKDREESSG